ncbi:MAG: signal peptidase I [Spirochaetes bacterium]|nr:signal peptidase I [Spirochaetota bacterium]
MTKPAETRAGFPQALQSFTERILTRRRKRKLTDRMKQQRRNPVLDWIYAILWAACVVLVINQYVFQNYRIPSESMVDTLLIGDMIFVDKFSFGPELLPGMAKLPGLAKPQRGQIIVFENPSYLSKGPIFTVVQQMLYMLTLTLVDIDRDENGEQLVHYLIKRQVGAAGDRIKVERGEVFISPEGQEKFLAEPELMKQLGLTRKAHRLVAASEYAAIEGVGAASAYQETGLKSPEVLGNPSISSAYKDAFGYDKVRVSELRDMDPSDARIAASERRYEKGWYIPEGRVFPMGDNRDNSRDARYFGPVSVNRVLGRALFIYWPLGRAGGIR